MHGNFIGFIHWPRLWAVLPPMCLEGSYDPNSFSVPSMSDCVWHSGENWNGCETIPVKVQRDGTFLFEFSSYLNGELSPKGEVRGRQMGEIESVDERRCDVLNTFLLFLNATLSREQKLQVNKLHCEPNKLVIETRENGILNNKGDSLTNEISKARFSSTYNIRSPIAFDWRVRMHPGHCVYEATLNEVFKQFDDVMKNENVLDIVPLCALLHRAYCDAETKSFRASIVHSWLVAERVLEKIYMENGFGSGDKAIKMINKLRGKPNYAEIPLCLECTNGNFGEETKFCKMDRCDEHDNMKSNYCLNRARSTRNALLHDHAKPGFNEAREGIRVAEQLLEAKFKIVLGAPLQQVAYTW